MHTVHLVTVDYLGAEASAADYDSESLAADWSDWYEVGGRWTNLFGDSHPDAVSMSDGNVLPLFTGNAVFARTALEHCQAQVNNAFLTARDALTGTPVLAADVDGHMFGIPVANTEDVAERISASNAKSAGVWQRILAAPTLTDALAVSDSFMVLSHLRTIADLLYGNHTPDTGFADLINGDTLAGFLADGLRNLPATEAEADTALLVVDYHY